MKATISVIMPAYNTERYVSQAIKSILQQSYPHFEFLIIDDGSTDRTPDILQEYAKKDARIRVILQEHRGISETLNRGIEEARYDWIAIMHADDIALPHRLERQMQAAMTNPRVVAWGAYAYHISEKGKVLGLSKVGATSEEEFYTKRRNGEIIHLIHSTAFMRKEAVLRVGGYNSLFDGSEDLELFDRLSELAPVLAIPEPLLLYRIHASSVTLQRFFKMRTFTRFIRARQRAKAEGREPPTWDEFIRVYESASVFKQLRRKIDDLSQFYYRRFAVAVSSEHYFKGLLFFAISALLNPRYAVLKAWNQRFTKDARRALKNKFGSL
ncbi:MAG: glycosyltransferase family 2 protein [Candidatus Bathyarchaeia archaeon]